MSWDFPGPGKWPPPPGTLIGTNVHGVAKKTGPAEDDVEIEFENGGVPPGYFKPPIGPSCKFKKPGWELPEGEWPEGFRDFILAAVSGAAGSSSITMQILGQTVHGWPYVDPDGRVWCVNVSVTGNKAVFTPFGEFTYPQPASSDIERHELELPSLIDEIMSYVPGGANNNLTTEYDALQNSRDVFSYGSLLDISEDGSHALFGVGLINKLWLRADHGTVFGSFVEIVISGTPGIDVSVDRRLVRNFIDVFPPQHEMCTGGFTGSYDNPIQIGFQTFYEWSAYGTETTIYTSTRIASMHYGPGLELIEHIATVQQIVERKGLGLNAYSISTKIVVSFGGRTFESGVNVYMHTYMWHQTTWPDGSGGGSATTRISSYEPGSFTSVGYETTKYFAHVAYFSNSYRTYNMSGDLCYIPRVETGLRFAYLFTCVGPTYGATDNIPDLQLVSFDVSVVTPSGYVAATIPSWSLRQPPYTYPPIPGPGGFYRGFF